MCKCWMRARRVAQGVGGVGGGVVGLGRGGGERNRGEGKG